VEVLSVFLQLARRLRILTWGIGGEGVGGGVFDDDAADVEGAAVQTEEIMVPLGWEHPSGCPSEFSTFASLAQLLLASLVAWPEVVVLALPEHLSGNVRKDVARDLAAIFASRYPPALLILSGPPSLIQEFEAQAPTPPHLERVQEMGGVGGEGWVTMVYRSAPGWGGRGSLLDSVNGELHADDTAGIAQGRGCVLVGNGPSLNAMTDDGNTNSSRGHALRLLDKVACVVGANKFWLGSARFGFQPSVFVAQDVHVMQVVIIFIVSIIITVLISATNTHARARTHTHARAHTHTHTHTTTTASPPSPSSITIIVCILSSLSRLLNAGWITSHIKFAAGNAQTGFRHGSVIAGVGQADKADEHAQSSNQQPQSPS
jgi:hypothetical protein